MTDKLAENPPESQSCPRGYSLESGSSWTPEGKFIVAHDAARGIYMLRTDIPEVIFINNQLAKSHAAGWLSVSVRPSDAPGLLMVNRRFVTDYRGNDLADLGRGDWTIFPDGRKAAMVNEKGELVIKELKLASTQPAR